MNFAKFLRTHFLTRHLQWLLLTHAILVMSDLNFSKSTNLSIYLSICNRSIYSIYILLNSFGAYLLLVAIFCYLFTLLSIFKISYLRTFSLFFSLFINYSFNIKFLWGLHKNIIAYYIFIQPSGADIKISFYCKSNVG